MYYRCLLSQHLVTSSPFCYISFLPGDPPKITQHPECKSVATGQSTTFTVEATGDNLHYQWQKDDIDLSDDNRNHDTGTHTLRIMKVEKSDNKARYQCLVKNEIGEEFSKDALLTVSKLVINVVDACLQKL